MIRSYEKGTVVRKRYEATKKVRSYEKGTKLRTWYEATKKVRSDGKGTKMLRSKLRKALVMKLPSYEIVTPPIGIIYYNA
jgi:outer membrane lipoprotein-sorting protein